MTAKKGSKHTSSGGKKAAASKKSVAKELKVRVDPLTRILLDSAQSMARKTKAKAILLYTDAIPDLSLIKDIASTFPFLLVARSDEKLALAKTISPNSIKVPPVNLSRMGQIKIAVLIAILRDMLSPGDLVVCLSGQLSRGGLDTVVMLEVGAEMGLITPINEWLLTKHVRPEVFERVISLATKFAIEGREGKPIGTIFVIGDEETVSNYSSQLVINPFRGYAEEERNILDPAMVETLREFCALDGAFIIRGDGVIMTAGAYLRPAAGGEELPQGLGARHAASAATTASTNAVAIVISESTGTVRIFKEGKMLVEIERGPH